MHFQIAICYDSVHIVEKIERLFEAFDWRFRMSYDVFYKIAELQDYMQKNQLRYSHYLLKAEASGYQFAVSLYENGNDAKITYIYLRQQWEKEMFVTPVFGILEAPLKERELKQICKRINSDLDNRGGTFCFSFFQTVRALEYAEIMWMQKNNRKLLIYARDREYQCYMKIEDAWSNLNDKRFLRVSYSCIVNIDYVSYVDKTGICMKKGAYLAVSRMYRKEVGEIYPGTGRKQTGQS